MDSDSDSDFYGVDAAEAENDVPKVLKSSRGKDCLAFKGFLFYSNRTPITVAFQYAWLDEMFKEMATYVFFVLTGYKFRPVSQNPYFSMHDVDDDDDDEVEILTQTGLTEGISKVTNRSQPPGTMVHESNEEERENLISKRESSHEYD